MHLSTFQTLSVINFFHQKGRDISVIQRKRKNYIFWFSALLFPKGVLKVIGCKDIAVRV